jgi:hypothetical protein
MTDQKDALEAWAIGQMEELSAVTLKDMNDFLERMCRIDVEIEALELQVKEKNKEYHALEARVLNILEASGQKGAECASGKFTKTKRVSVKQPATPEAKAAFFQYLKDKGDFDNMISVNSRTLSSYVKKEIEAQEEEGVLNFVPPGLEKPETIHYLSLKRKS